MKKVISIILSLIILIFSFSYLVSAENVAELSIQDEKVYAGDDFTVNLFISDNSQLSGAVIDIKYDNEKLEFVSAKEGGILDPTSNISIRNIKDDNSYVRFTYMSANSSVSTKGILFSVTFKALENAKGKTDLEITVPNAADFINSDLEKISYSVDNAEIEILENISIEKPTEPISEDISASDTTEISQSETTTNNVVNDKNENKNDMSFMIALLLVGIALICFGVVVAIKKKK